MDAFDNFASGATAVNYLLVIASCDRWRSGSRVFGTLVQLIAIALLLSTLTGSAARAQGDAAVSEVSHIDFSPAQPANFISLPLNMRGFAATRLIRSAVESSVVVSPTRSGTASPAT
jgi:hypothetical protein